MLKIIRVTCPKCGKEHLLSVEYDEDKKIIRSEYSFSCTECFTNLSFEIKNAKNLNVKDAFGNIIKFE